MNSNPAVFHRSSRTAVSLNTDPGTGRRVQTLNTSTLEMDWLGEELRIKFIAARATVDPDRPRRAPGSGRGV